MHFLLAPRRLFRYSNIRASIELALEKNPALARTYFDFAASRERVAVVEVG